MVNYEIQYTGKFDMLIYIFGTNSVVVLSPDCTNGRMFFKLDSNVHPNWAMCRTHLTLVPALALTFVGV